MGYIIVAVSGIIYLPMIYKILKCKSVIGLSFTSNYIELLGFMFIIGYNNFNNYSFNLWGEYLLLFLQSFTIFILFGIYGRKLVSIDKFFISFISLLILALPFFFNLVPSLIYDLSILISILILFSSKVPQILLNY